MNGILYRRNFTSVTLKVIDFYGVHSGLKRPCASVTQQSTSPQQQAWILIQVDKIVSTDNSRLVATAASSPLCAY